MPFKKGQPKRGGRQKGSKNKNSIAAEAAKAGTLPLDYMLMIMRDEQQPSERRDDMAKAAAPYLHARLQSTALSSDPAALLRHEKVTITIVDPKRTEMEVPRERSQALLAQDGRS